MTDAELIRRAHTNLDELTRDEMRRALRVLMDLQTIARLPDSTIDLMGEIRGRLRRRVA